jgi:hypothetical protein
MPLQARITNVTHTQTVTRDDGTTGTTDLSTTGELLVTAEYFDSATPSTVLHRQVFQVPSTESEVAITDRIIAVGRRMRDARARTSSMQALVGTTIPIA